MTNGQDFRSSAPPHLVLTDRESAHIRRDFTRLHRGVYVDPTMTLTATDRIRAALLSAGDGAVVAGTSAHFLHGAAYPDIGGDVELIRDLRGQGRARSGVRLIRTDTLRPDDVVNVAGMRTTSVVRTAFDLGRRRPDWLALGHLDDLARTAGLTAPDLWSYTKQHDHTSGIRQLRELVGLLDPAAESPGESWLRLLMHRHKLPKPESQIEVFDDAGALIARFDLGYRRYKIGIDYDGVDHHRTDEQLRHDRQRDAEVRRRGWLTFRTRASALSADVVAEMTRFEHALRLKGHRF